MEEIREALAGFARILKDKDPHLAVVDPHVAIMKRRRRQADDEPAGESVYSQITQFYIIQDKNTLQYYSLLNYK
jgi:hypothetical protein